MRLTKPTACTLLALTAANLHVLAQSQLDQVQTTERNTLAPSTNNSSQNQLAPTIYDGELEDIGPQYLLLQQPPRDWFEFFADLQIYSSDNAVLLESNPEGTDILAFTAQAAFVPYVSRSFGGELKTRVGYRQQHFLYGTFAKGEETISGTPSDDLDFNNRQPFADISWLSGPLSIRLGIHYSELRTSGSNDRFYTEFVPSWSIAYDLELDQRSLLTFTYNGNLRQTESESFGLLPDDWNDQTEHSFSVTYSRLLSEKWMIQATGGLEYAYYTQSDRDREDVLGFTSVTLAYFISDNVTTRLFASYDARESSESFTDDYRNFNIGGGISLNWAL